MTGLKIEKSQTRRFFEYCIIFFGVSGLTLAVIMIILIFNLGFPATIQFLVFSPANLILLAWIGIGIIVSLLLTLHK
jgi:hypothetical protein